MKVMKQRIGVDALAVGMYVCDLDRPWLETPFLLEGISIESDADIEALKKHCRHVFIDVMRSIDTGSVERQMKGIARLREVNERGDAARVKADDPIVVDFAREMDRAQRARDDMHAYIDKVMADARLGNQVGLEEARVLVETVIDSISVSADASLWLCQLKRADATAATHSVNACVISTLFARYLGLPDDLVRATGIGGLFHDIGKVRVPSEILNKPGPLTAQEYDAVKLHTVEGYNVMRLLPGIPPEALDIIRHHHERVDGMGYPDGLEGEELKQPARIVAIAEMYDTLTHDTAYDYRMPPNDALALMLKEAPTHFGAGLMEDFIKCIGIYPVGTLVRLHSGQIAIVASNHAKHRLLPVVMLLLDAEGHPYQRHPLVNLASMVEREGGNAWRIQGGVSPADVPIDLATLSL
ncbi:MAG TPA: HD-GYP domain-containing protein [Thioalkalivibrio sp.]|nr:HD-GYP domain-containing protein [Thioalkalivibrio sp.]